jgi:hypothetical protein
MSAFSAILVPAHAQHSMSSVGHTRFMFRAFLDLVAAIHLRRTSHADVFNVHPSGCGFRGRKVRCRSPHCPTHENIVSSTVIMVPSENTLAHCVFNSKIHVSIKEVLLASVFPIDVFVWHLKNHFHCRNRRHDAPECERARNLIV